MKTVLILLLLATTSGCQHNSIPNTRNLSDKIVYFKDERTGLCFAAINSATEKGSRITSFTTVDCEKVRDFLKK
jgi:hypothetical protein